MDQFVKGLKHLNVYAAVTKHPDTFKDYFIYKETPVSAGENKAQLNLMHCIKCCFLNIARCSMFHFGT